MEWLKFLLIFQTKIIIIYIKYFESERVLTLHPRLTTIKIHKSNKKPKKKTIDLYQHKQNNFVLYMYRYIVRSTLPLNKCNIVWESQTVHKTPIAFGHSEQITKRWTKENPWEFRLWFLSPFRTYDSLFIAVMIQPTVL